MLFMSVRNAVLCGYWVAVAVEGSSYGWVTAVHANSVTASFPNGDVLTIAGDKIVDVVID